MKTYKIQKVRSLFIADTNDKNGTNGLTQTHPTKPALEQHHFMSKPSIVGFSSFPERKLSGVMPMII